MVKYNFLLVFVLGALLLGCSTQKAVTSHQEKDIVVSALEDSLYGAHLGVMVFDPLNKKLITGYNHHKYFVPASNTKLLSLYAGLKYLPDTLLGLQYKDAGDTVYAYPTGDPTLGMAEFKQQPVLQWLLQQKKPVVISVSNWRAERYGRGWSWSDYQANYQPERSALPVYGNLMPVQLRSKVKFDSAVNPTSEKQLFTLTMGPVSGEGLKLKTDGVVFRKSGSNRFRINRDYAGNSFLVEYAPKDTVIETEVPFVTNGIETALRILRNLPANGSDSLNITASESLSDRINFNKAALTSVWSQPLDSMLKPMMHRSDNFYAEQTLLMASNAFLGYMSDRDMIDTLLKTDLKDMPDKPVWADGSGLSRYNLFSPADFVWLLDKLKTEFGMNRLQTILPTGNDGTLRNYYKPLEGKMFAKTGTLSGHVALSGILYAKSGKMLIFSVLVNNHNTEATRVRRLVEQYLLKVWEAN